MITKSCFIFAVTIHKKDKLYVLHEILNTIKQHYSDIKIFMGINYQSLPDVEFIIDSYNLNCKYERLIDEDLYSLGDESAYQLALKLMINDSDKFDVCWFMHTKGGHNNRDLERRMYLNNFFAKRNQIETRFQNLNFLGVYGYRCMAFGIDPQNPVIKDTDFMKDLWSEKCDEFFKYTHCPVILIETMFCMKAKIIYDFIEKYPNFLTSKLRKYFFECEFCNILPTRLGYYPATILGNHLYYYDITQDLSSLVDTWISENNLSHLKEYKKYNTNIL